MKSCWMCETRVMEVQSFPMSIDPAVMDKLCKPCAES